MDNADIDSLIDRVYKKYENENPLEWKRDISFFYAPTICLLLSLFFITVQRPPFMMIFSLLIFNFGYMAYNFMLFSNQRIYVYSTKLVYHYGILNQKVKTFIYGSDEISGIKAGMPLNVLQKTLGYGNFYIMHKSGLGLKIPFVKNPNGLFELLKEKFLQFNREFDPEYELPPTEIIKSSGVYVENEQGKLVKKHKQDNIDNAIEVHIDDKIDDNK